MVPRWAQDGSNMAPRGPERPQQSPKIAPRGPGSASEPIWSPFGGPVWGTNYVQNTIQTHYLCSYHFRYNFGTNLGTKFGPIWMSLGAVLKVPAPLRHKMTFRCFFFWRLGHCKISKPIGFRLSLTYEREPCSRRKTLPKLPQHVSTCVPTWPQN